ncbi:ESPR-type extended signal peptide-containing protein [Stenotrophomonas lactitubi]|uniref:ESPR-type extended signal peptide-containing protein n=1 Tax=Stenotrophomonas lactitubi TaxID=2045214 RepID=UPI0022492C71|nr:ESPR-type extended signal peptide-containing protein [Stenotrophomonas lactitubi]MCX2893244.1 ESPR-type extended signal peptide-containing protein [Stenotrophomonas lactitubi]
MNKIYRRLWSTARQCWVVASELTSPRGKPASSVGAAVLIVTASLVPGAGVGTAGAVIYHACQNPEQIILNCVPFMAHVPSMAQNTLGPNTSSYMMLGAGSHMQGRYSSLFGNWSSSVGDNNAVFGFDARARQGGSAVFGARSEADGFGAVAVGTYAHASGDFGIAMGYAARTADNSGGISRIAIGNDSYAGTPGWTGAIAFGGRARAEYDSVALGYEAQAKGVGSVALGRGAVATESYVVSVGNAAAPRRVVYVADGNVSQYSMDAVNGRQLLGVKETAERALDNSKLVTQASASGQIRVGAENSGTVLDVRNRSNANRKISGVADAALSTTSTEAVTGKQLNATNVEVASVRTTATNAQTTAGAAKTAADDALAKANALGGLVGQTSVTGNVRLGGENTGTVLDVRNKSNASRKLTGVADATLNTSSTEAVSGKQLNATNVEVASVRTTATSAQTTADAAKTTADNALGKADVLGGLVGQVSATGNVRLGGENTGTVLDVRNKSNANRKLMGVADATLSTSSTEAVSGKQLNATNTEVASVRSAAANAQTTANIAQTTADSAFAKARATGNAVATAAEVNDANKATATGHLAMAMGNVAKANGVATVAVGNNSNAVGTNAISIGSASGATGPFALALGGNAKATHENAVALGEKSVTGGTNQVSIGNATLKRKLVNVADATLSSTSTDAVTGKQVFAVDQKVTANQSLLASHATELAGHEARIAGNRRDLDDLRTEFDNFDPDLEGVVRYAADGSVDMDGGKVRGVAAGDISSAGSTDAVNGGQLFVTNQRLSQVEETARYIAIGHDDESIDAKAGEFSVAIGDGAEAGEGTDGATAIGAFSRARGEGSVALGRASFVDSSAENGFALGTGSSVHSNEGVALGGFARIESGAEYSVALGASSTATEENVVSVGNLTRKRRIVNLARGRGAEDAVTVGQLGDSLAALGGGAGIDPGGNIILPTYKVQGGSQNNVEDALNVLDGAVVAGKNRADRIENQLRSVFQESPATRSDGLGQLNLAGANGMVLGNVANGLIAPGSRDAVNGGQLHAMEQRLDGRIDGLEQRVDATPEGRALASASAPTPPAAPEAEGPAGASGDPAAASAGRAGGGIASADGGGTPAPADAPAPTPQVDTAELEKMLARANEYTDGAISNFERRLDKMDKRFNRMAAMSSAQTAMAMNTAGLATYNRLGAGVGYAEGESAMAVGYQRVLNEKGSATFSLNGAFTNSGERSMGVGVGIGW